VALAVAAGAAMAATAAQALTKMGKPVVGQMTVQGDVTMGSPPTPPPGAPNQFSTGLPSNRR
jgi:hypothetical protein